MGFVIHAHSRGFDIDTAMKFSKNPSAPAMSDNNTNNPVSGVANINSSTNNDASFNINNDTRQLAPVNGDITSARQHRFGQIKTYWACTNEHSLTNWYAHSKIWERFD